MGNLEPLSADITSGSTTEPTQLMPQLFGSPQTNALVWIVLILGSAYVAYRITK